MSSLPALPPGPRGLPLLGNTLQFQRDQMGFMRETQQRFPRIATVYVAGVPVVFCFRPEHVLYMLTEHPRNFTSLQSNGGLKAFLGDGLLTIEGDYHRQQRRLVQPAFHKRRIEGYADVMVQYTQEMLAGWQAGSEVNIAYEMQQLTLRIIVKTLFNVESRVQVTEIGEAFTNILDAPPPPPREMKLLQLFQRVRGERSAQQEQKVAESQRTLDSFIYDLIAQRRATGQDTGDVLSMLLEAQEGSDTMSDKQVHDHVLTFIAAGHETAQNTLSWTFYLLSQHPEVLAKLINELQTVLGGRAPTVADLANLPYLEWVINESWRVYPPAWRQGRRAIEAFDMDGYHFPAGTLFLLSQWVMHNLPEIWGDPEVFRPERWDPEHEQKIPHGAYFPFGAGPRICIGMPFAQMETRLLLATILQKYAPRLVPGFQVVLLPRVTLRPKYGMRMILEPTASRELPVSV